MLVCTIVLFYLNCCILAMGSVIRIDGESVSKSQTTPPADSLTDRNVSETLKTTSEDFGEMFDRSNSTGANQKAHDKDNKLEEIPDPEFDFDGIPGALNGGAISFVLNNPLGSIAKSADNPSVFDAEESNAHNDITFGQKTNHERPNDSKDKGIRFTTEYGSNSPERSFGSGKNKQTISSGYSITGSPSFVSHDDVSSSASNIEGSISLGFGNERLLRYPGYGNNGGLGFEWYGNTQGYDYSKGSKNRELISFGGHNNDKKVFEFSGYGKGMSTGNVFDFVDNVESSNHGYGDRGGSEWSSSLGGGVFGSVNSFGYRDDGPRRWPSILSKTKRSSDGLNGYGNPGNSLDSHTSNVYITPKNPGGIFGNGNSKGLAGYLLTKISGSSAHENNGFARSSSYSDHRDFSNNKKRGTKADTLYDNSVSPQFRDNESVLFLGYEDVKGLGVSSSYENRGSGEVSRLGNNGGSDRSFGHVNGNPFEHGNNRRFDMIGYDNNGEFGDSFGFGNDVNSDLTSGYGQNKDSDDRPPGDLVLLGIVREQGFSNPNWHAKLTRLIANANRVKGNPMKYGNKHPERSFGYGNKHPEGSFGYGNKHPGGSFGYGNTHPGILSGDSSGYGNDMGHGSSSQYGGNKSPVHGNYGNNEITVIPFAHGNNDEYGLILSGFDVNNGGQASQEYRTKEEQDLASYSLKIKEGYSPVKYKYNNIPDGYVMVECNQFHCPL